MKRLALLSLLLIAAPVMAMESDDGYSSDEKDATELEMYLGGQTIYIGKGKDRDDLERCYGVMLPLNTFFVQISFHNYRKELKTYEPFKTCTKLPSVPKYIPYDWIKDAKEGDQISLPIYTAHLVARCKQKRYANPYGRSSFEKMLKSCVEQFKCRVNWFPEDEESLKAGGVIDTTAGLSKHGPNGYPFEEDSPAQS